MAKSFRELTGTPPSTASPADSTLIIIDAQNEYVYSNAPLWDPNVRLYILCLFSLLRWARLLFLGTDQPGGVALRSRS
jgi:hypothetical protein